MSDRPTAGSGDDAELGASRAHLERRLDELGVDLSDPALWLEPPQLQSSVVELTSAPAPPDAPRRWSWRWLAVAAVLIAVVGVGSLVVRDRPDWSIDFAPTSDYSEAQGTLDGWNEGTETRMVLNVDGVPPAPAGFFYEMWMSRGPIHISAGTFSDMSEVELRAGVLRTDYPRLWVTLEPIDEDESPTSVVVLDTG